VAGNAFSLVECDCRNFPIPSQPAQPEPEVSLFHHPAIVDLKVVHENRLREALAPGPRLAQEFCGFQRQLGVTQAAIGKNLPGQGHRIEVIFDNLG
jgi:hypothetical protein